MWRRGWWRWRWVGGVVCADRAVYPKAGRAYRWEWSAAADYLCSSGQLGAVERRCMNRCAAWRGHRSGAGAAGETVCSGHGGASGSAPERVRSRAGGAGTGRVERRSCRERRRTRAKRDGDARRAGEAWYREKAPWAWNERKRGGDAANVAGGARRAGERRECGAISVRGQGAAEECARGTDTATHVKGRVEKWSARRIAEGGRRSRACAVRNCSGCESALWGIAKNANRLCDVCARELSWRAETAGVTAA